MKLPTEQATDLGGDELKRKEYLSPEFDFVLVRIQDNLCESKTEGGAGGGGWGGDPGTEGPRED